MSQSELATRLGVTPGAISQWELDAVNILGENLVKVAAVLGVSAGDLLTGEGDPSLRKLDITRLEAALSAIESLPKLHTQRMSNAAKAKLIAHLYLVGVHDVSDQELVSLAELVG
jgi:transcriptional regulator with XRE-family HTH domain